MRSSSWVPALSAIEAIEAIDALDAFSGDDPSWLKRTLLEVLEVLEIIDACDADPWSDPGGKLYNPLRDANEATDTLDADRCWIGLDSPLWEANEATDALDSERDWIPPGGKL